MSVPISPVTRRTFLAAIAATPVVRAHRAFSQLRSALVIGAGLSGLHAAALLEAAGFTVTVLEGRSRVGGRVFTLDGVAGQPEAGGEVIGEHYRRLRATATKLGVPVTAIGAPSGPQGLTLSVRGELMPLDQWREAASRFGLNDVERAVPPAGLMGVYLRAGNPLKNSRDWIDGAYAELDRLSLAALISARGATPEAVRLMAVAPNCQRLQTASALWAFRDAQRRRDGGTQAFLVAGGASRLTERMAAALSAPVKLGQTVSRIEASSRGVEVRCVNGQTYSADVAVCTLPAPVLKTIALRPALPPTQQQAIAALPYTAITKVMLEVTRPFWEADGLPPQMWTDSAIERVFPITSGGRVVGLHVWIDGAGAQVFDRRPIDAQAALVEAELARLRPSTKGAVRVQKIVSWEKDEMAGGAYAHFAPGQIAAVRPWLATRAGRLAFAGEHTAVEAAGMEGAFESAERSVAELTGDQLR